jgi:hypothetical protein
MIFALIFSIIAFPAPNHLYSRTIRYTREETAIDDDNSEMLGMDSIDTEWSSASYPFEFDLEGMEISDSRINDSNAPNNMEDLPHQESNYESFGSNDGTDASLAYSTDNSSNDIFGNAFNPDDDMMYSVSSSSQFDDADLTSRELQMDKLPETVFKDTQSPSYSIAEKALEPTLKDWGVTLQVYLDTVKLKKQVDVLFKDGEISDEDMANFEGLLLQATFGDCYYNTIDTDQYTAWEKNKGMSKKEAAKSILKSSSSYCWKMENLNYIIYLAHTIYLSQNTLHGIVIQLPKSNFKNLIMGSYLRFLSPPQAYT